MDSTPGLEVYESYEQDYKQLAGSISGKLQGEAKEAKGGQSMALMQSTRHGIDELIHNAQMPAKPSTDGWRWSSKRLKR